MTVDSVQVNLDLPADYFERKFPQGLDIYDEVLDMSYRVGEAVSSLQKVDELMDETGNDAGLPSSNDAVVGTSNDNGTGVGKQGHDEEVQSQKHTSGTANQEVKLGLSLTKKYLLVGLGLLMAVVVVVGGRKMRKRPREDSNV